MASGTIFSSFDMGVVLALAGFTATSVCAWVWVDPKRRSLAWLGHSLGVALLTVMALAAMGGLVADVLSLAPFDVAYAQFLTALLVPTLAGVPFAWAVFECFSSVRKRVTLPKRMRRRVAAIVVVWGGVGYVTSFIFESFALIPNYIVDQKLGGTAATLIQTLSWGKIATIMVGMTAITALAVVGKRA
ncbi:hypothetical protein [Haloarcula salinisoli]|uniref:Uncharacterized protein n=1 Tax=Haloarcula salinisoli TaxID=2487746 RepID=A0A8J7YIW4_9EURY|nr:hypothetical protein [Halomicroarcula salinisoli]MBX0302048.1 hypothetical protein [Halomicroarcula salinisoli]